MKNSVLDRLKSYFNEYFLDATKPTARNLFLIIVSILALDIFRSVRFAHRHVRAIYEPVFLDCMYGFRSGRGCHDALRALNWVIEKRKTQWVLDADIKSYFDRIPHKRLLDCLKVKIKGKR